MRGLSILVLVLAHLVARGATSGTQASPMVLSWLKAQTQVRSWSADFTQIRTLKSLAQPLTASGHVWFTAPNQFRWELGHPAQTIAVRASQELLVIYPRLKRIERFPLNGQQAGPWRDALGLLEVGFPQSQSELEAQYDILSQDVKDEACELALQPKSAAARRMMPGLKIWFDTRTFALRSTELRFADGSTMRNDFSNPELNPHVDPQLFSPPVPSDFKVVEPLRKS
jgi:outer membrane lipoprotein-sorting protein